MVEIELDNNRDGSYRDSDSNRWYTEMEGERD